MGQNAATVRASLIVATALAWAIAIWIAIHTSADHEILGLWSRAYFGFVAGSAAVALLLTIANTGPVYRLLYRVRGRLLALLLSVIAALAGVELLVRIADPLGISYYEESRRYHLDKIADPDLVYRHRSDFRRTYEGVDCSFNEMGLRERPVGRKGPEEFRILVLGDSVTLGLGVEVEATFARRLEALAERRMGRPVRTINAGVGSYNTTQEFTFLKLRGEELAPDLVVLMYVDNDVELNLPPFDPWRALSLSGKNPPQAIEILLWHSRLYRLLAHVMRHGGSGEAAPDRSAPGWQESMARVASIADLCRERRVPLAIFLWRMAASPLTDAQWQDLSSIAKEKGFALGDMESAFRGVDARKLTNSAVDVHPNSEGHRLAAEMMDEFLASRGLLAR